MASCFNKNERSESKNNIGVDIKQLSCLCGVSTAMVSLVLNNKSRGRVSETRRQQILRAAEEYGYKPQHAAKELDEGRTYRVGLAIQGTLSDHAVIGELSFYYRFGLMAKILSRHGYAIEMVQTGINQSAENMVRVLNRLAIDGLLFLCWPSEPVVSTMTRLHEFGIPVVACGSFLSFKCTPRLSHYDLQIKEQADFSVNTLLKAIDCPTTQPCVRLFKPKYLARET